MTAIQFIMVKDSNRNGQGPLGGERFSTIWLVNGKPFLVSSVNNNHTVETMLFPVINGEVDYMERWCEKEYLSNPSQHANFINAYLEYNGDLS
tara:strand:- start:1275 stop:1553 length:279 start_codon:yes stop_codon:yes gene_type:complete